MMEEKRHGVDITKDWMVDHKFKFHAWIEDKYGYRFASIYSFDGKNYITCSYRGFRNRHVGLDCEIIDRDPIIVNKMKEIAKEKNLPNSEYVALIFELNSKNLYDADRIYDLKTRNYPIEYGNEISKNNPHM